ncbi:MAG: FAD-binding oxidoreductase [Snowella sp.]|jgi:glycolate oxidase FAD binding subunit|nr:MAG: FAD-binding oxidoreductase [Snowella sp.]
MSSLDRAKLESLLDPQTEISDWEELNPDLQSQITRAIRNDQPSHWLAPSTVEDLSHIVSYATEMKSSMLLCGNGSKLGWGGLVKQADFVLSTQKLNRILDHAIADLTVTVEAGVKLTDLQAFLKPHRQFLPIDPSYPEQATIGGIVATADSGSWRQRYGGIRDLVLGCSIVRWDGKIAKAGGKVVKNVAGYDLMKLFTGSYGTLGVLTQVTFRLYPLPEDSKTLLLTGDAQALSQACQDLLKSGLAPTSADVLSCNLMRSLELGNNLGLLVRFQNIAESVTEQVDQLQALGQKLGLSIAEFTAESEASLWQSLKNQMMPHFNPDLVTCKIGVMSNQIVNFLQESPGLAQIHLASGLGRLVLTTDSEIEQLSKMRSVCERDRGFLTILEAPKNIKEKHEPWGYQGNALNLMKSLKTKFDPYNIFNSGCFVGEI